MVEMLDDLLPKVPPPPCTATASKGSSKRNLSIRSWIPIKTGPAMAPIRIAAHGSYESQPAH